MDTLWKYVKKFFYHLSLGSLAAGAISIIVLLSFAGMWSLSGMLGLAIFTGILLGLYEGQVYLKNIQDCLKKVFKKHYLKRHLADEFLKKHVWIHERSKDPDFIKDYRRVKQDLARTRAEIELAEKKGQHQKKRDLLRQRKILEKDLKIYKKMFCKILFAKRKDRLTDYQFEVWTWLNEGKKDSDKARNEAFHAIKPLLARRQWYYFGAGAWSFVFSFLASSVGSLFLLGGTYSILPAGLIAAIPFLTTPIGMLIFAGIAGLAFSCMTFNSITNFINHVTGMKWVRYFFGKGEDSLQGLNKNWKKALMIGLGLVLFSLGIFMAACTGGTWGALFFEVPSFLSWISQVPGWFMGIMCFFVPTAMAISTAAFNLENISETLEETDNKLKAGPLPEEPVKTKSNIFQHAFRICFKPLRYLFFGAHLVAEGVMVEAAFNWPDALLSGFGTANATAVDYIYFLGEEKDCDHGHNHHNDLPTLLIKYGLLGPLLLAAYLWNMAPVFVNWLLCKPCKKIAPVQDPVDQSGLEMDPLSERGKAAVASYRIMRCMEKNQVDKDQKPRLKELVNELEKDPKKRKTTPVLLREAQRDPAIRQPRKWSQLPWVSPESCAKVALKDTGVHIEPSLAGRPMVC